MRIYLCARYGRRAELQGYANTLRQDGHEVVADWLDGPADDDDVLTPAEAHCIATTDMLCIDAADVVMVFSERPDSMFGRGGRHFETGYAYAKRKRIVVVGPLENVFHYADGVRYAPDFEKARVGLKLLSCTIVNQS